MLLAKIKLYSILFLIFGGLIGGAYLYVLNLQSKVENLIIVNQGLLDDLASAEIQFNFEKSQHVLSKNRLEILDNQKQGYVKQINYLRGVFGKHDFEKLISKKPQLITNRMIKSTKKVWKELKDVTNSD